MSPYWPGYNSWYAYVDGSLYVWQQCKTYRPYLNTYSSSVLSFDLKGKTFMGTILLNSTT